MVQDGCKLMLGASWAEVAALWAVETRLLRRQACRGSCCLLTLLMNTPRTAGVMQSGCRLRCWTCARWSR